MFGGLAYMVNGHMCVGILEDRLIARVGPTAYEDCLELPYARAMDFTGRPMNGFIYVDPPGIASEADLKRWVDRCLRFVEERPAIPRVAAMVKKHTANA